MRGKDLKLDQFDLTGKTALITGAGGLLGIEHATALLDVGAKVILTDLNEDALLTAYTKLEANNNSMGIHHKVMDVGSAHSIEETATTLKEEGIHVDILINNAAIDPKVLEKKGLAHSSRLENLTLEEWTRQVTVGLTGAFLCSRKFGSLMAQKGDGGVILNISSDLSILAPDQRLYEDKSLPRYMQPVKPVTYSVIKSGLLGLTRYLATYWLDEGIRCNALSPGGIENGQGDEFIKKISALIPAGRMARKNEYHSAVQFLCSDASSYMTGQNIVMDGGRSIW